MTIDFRNLDASKLELFPIAEAVQPIDHFVEFYDEDSALIGSVRRFMTMGLSQGEAAVIVADPGHGQAFDKAIARDVDLEEARARGLYTSLDADEVLGSFMANGLPDAEKFDRAIGDLLRNVSSGGRKVRVFGEMVAILWAQGNAEGALQLEDLWNQLAQRIRFRLFCAYPTASFGDISPVHSVCERHSHVLVAANERSA